MFNTLQFADRFGAGSCLYNGMRLDAIWSVTLPGTLPVVQHDATKRAISTIAPEVQRT